MNEQPMEALAQVLKAVSSVLSPISEPWRGYALRWRTFSFAPPESHNCYAF